MKITNKIKTYLMGLGLALICTTWGYTVGKYPSDLEWYYNLTVLLIFGIPTYYILYGIDRYVEEE